MCICALVRFETPVIVKTNVRFVGAPSTSTVPVPRAPLLVGGTSSAAVSTAESGTGADVTLVSVLASGVDASVGGRVSPSVGATPSRRARKRCRYHLTTRRRKRRPCDRGMRPRRGKRLNHPTTSCRPRVPECTRCPQRRRRESDESSWDDTLVLPAEHLREKHSLTEGRTCSSGCNQRLAPPNTGSFTCPRATWKSVLGVAPHRSVHAMPTTAHCRKCTIPGRTSDASRPRRELNSRAVKILLVM